MEQKIKEQSMQEKLQEEKFIKMTESKIPGLIIELGIPTTISMLITSFYNMADTFFVGKIGTSATGGVGVVFSLMAIIQAMGFTFGHGSGNYISRQLGKHDYDDASQMASTGFFSALIAGALFGITGLIFIDKLVDILGATRTIAPYAKQYAMYILIGSPYMTASLVLNNQLRYQGSAFYAMVGIATGAVINIALDPILIFVFNMGTGGAGLATIISQFVSFLLLLRRCTKGGNLRLHFRDFKPSARLYKEIIRGGLPSFCRQGLSSLAVITLNFAAGIYGDAAIAAMSIVSKVTSFCFAAIMGFGQGFQPVCGFNYGAKLYGRVREAFFFCIKVITSFVIVLSIICIAGAPYIIQFFRKGDVTVTAIGTVALRAQALVFPLVGWITLTNMMLQTIGKAVSASILAMARQGIFFLPFIMVLSYYLGLTGIETAQTVADIASFLLALPLGIIQLRKLRLLEIQEM